MAIKPSRGTLARAWEEWWSERDRWFTKSVKAGLLVVYVLCLLMFFTSHGSGSKEAFKHEVGTPSPWFVVEKEPNGDHRFVVLFSSAWIVAGFGILAYYAYWRIRKTETGATSRFGLPGSHVLIWTLFAVIAVGMGFLPLWLDRLESGRAPVDRGTRAEADRGAGVPVESPLVAEPRTRPGRWVLTPEGPAVSDSFARILKLEPSEHQEVNSILQETYRQYQVLLEKHTEQETDDEGHLITTITPFREEITKLEEQLWAQIDPLLDQKEQAIARYNLPLHPKTPRLPTYPGARSLHDRGIFGWGDDSFRIEIWRVGEWFHWRVWPSSGSARAPQLPEVYGRFWNEPVDERDTDS